MKALYYQFVNFVQTMHSGLFMVLWLLLFAVILVLVMKFFKIYNGTQKNFEKISLIVLAILLFGLLIYFTYIR